MNAKGHLTDDDWKAIREEHAKFTTEEAREWIRKVTGPPKRILEGTEREHMLTVFRLVEPYSIHNNQRSFTEEYEHAGKKYDVTYFEDEVIVEEHLNEES